MAASVIQAPLIAFNNVATFPDLDENKSIDPDGSPRFIIVSGSSGGPWTFYLPGVDGNSSPAPALDGDVCIFVNRSGSSFNVANELGLNAIPDGKFVMFAYDGNSWERVLFIDRAN
jgi:hypothetical protein